MAKPYDPSRDWRTIPGHDQYQVNAAGDFRRLLPNGDTSPVSGYYHRRKTIARTVYCIKLSDGKGGCKEYRAMQLVVKTFGLHGKPGDVPYHRNGDKADNSVRNIAFTTRHQLGLMTGHRAGRRPVRKVTPDGETVEMYRSAREAAAANHISYQAIMDRCNRRIKKPFALDGHDYRWDDEERPGRPRKENP